MNQIARYKKLYGDGVVRYELGRIHLPDWLAMYFIHRSGLKSRKYRHIKKRLKRETMRAIRLGLSDEA